MTDIAQDLYDGLDAIVAGRADEVGPNGVAGWDATLWDELSRQGFIDIDPADPGVNLPEMLALARATGARAVGLPLVEVGLAAWAAQACGLKLPDGLVVPAVEANSVLVGGISDGDLVVSGRLPRVPWGRRADQVIALADTPEGLQMVAVAPTSVTEGENLAGEPRDAVTITDQRVLGPHAAPAGALTPDEIRLRAAVLRASQAAGAMESILNLTVEYAGQREQFGAPIATFQAVQQHLVTIATGAAAVRASVEAVVTVDAAHRRLAAASATITASIQSTPVARAAHQVFGAIGVTDEHQLHLLTRRLWSWQDEYGDAAEWSARLTDQLIFPGGPGVWPALTPPHPMLTSCELGESAAW